MLMIKYRRIAVMSGKQREITTFFRRTAASTDTPPPSRNNNSPRKRRKIEKPIPGPTGRLELPEGGAIVYEPNLFTAENSRHYYQWLMDNVGWAQHEVVVFGKKHLAPRASAYYADSLDLTYKYSGITRIPTVWPETMRAIKEKVEEVSGFQFNSCLLNLYRNGDDSMGYHADDEPEYGPEANIASVSFGATRDFLLRRNSSRGEKYVYSLESGSLLLMIGNVQQHWMHAVPKRANVNDARINLTFRTVIK